MGACERCYESVSEIQDLYFIHNIHLHFIQIHTFYFNILHDFYFTKYLRQFNYKLLVTMNPMYSIVVRFLLLFDSRFTKFNILLILHIKYKYFPVTSMKTQTHSTLPKLSNLTSKHFPRKFKIFQMLPLKNWQLRMASRI